MKYLTKNDFIMANAAIQSEAGSTPVVREPGLLDYIVESARQDVFGQQMYPTIVDLAAFYFENVVRKHIFNDANKRTAVMVLYTFLDFNGVAYDFSAEAQLRISNAAIYLASVDGLDADVDVKVKMTIRSIIQ